MHVEAQGEKENIPAKGLIADVDGHGVIDRFVLSYHKRNLMKANSRFIGE